MIAAEGAPPGRQLEVEVILKQAARAIYAAFDPVRHTGRDDSAGGTMKLAHALPRTRGGTLGYAHSGIPEL